jgi:hypothetical protein
VKTKFYVEKPCFSHYFVVYSVITPEVKLWIHNADILKINEKK